jgi:hypothetical protein
MNSLAEIEIERLESLPAATMLRLVEKSKKAKKNAAAFQAAISGMPALFNKLEELDIDPGFDLDSDHISVNFSGDGAKLGFVWGELRRHGYNTHSRPEKGKTEFYSFWVHESFCKIWLNFSSSVCRRVQVGTRTVTKEEPIYETQCGELPELEAAAPALTVIEGGASDVSPF